MCKRESLLMWTKVLSMCCCCKSGVTSLLYGCFKEYLCIGQGPDSLSEEHCKLSGLQDEPGGQAQGAHAAGDEAVCGPRAACGHLWAGAGHPLLLMHAHRQGGIAACRKGVCYTSGNWPYVGWHIRLLHIAIADQKHKAHEVLLWSPRRNKSVNIRMLPLMLLFRLRTHCKTSKPI